MTEWETEALPDFTYWGFHTGRKVEFRLINGEIRTDIYQGYGLFGVGAGYQWQSEVVAWREIP